MDGLFQNVAGAKNSASGRKRLREDDCVNTEPAMIATTAMPPATGEQAWADFLEHLATARAAAHRWAVEAHRLASDAAALHGQRIEAEIEACLTRAERVLREAVDRALMGPRDESNAWQVYTDTMRYVDVLLHEAESTRPHS